MKLNQVMMNIIAHIAAAITMVIIFLIVIIVEPISWIVKLFKKKEEY